jgi:hypothetical protein
VPPSNEFHTSQSTLRGCFWVTLITTLTHGAEPFLRSRQLCSYSRTSSQHITELEGPLGSRILSSPRRPHRFWGSPNLLSNGYPGKSGWSVKLTTHFQLMPMPRILGSIHPLPHMSSWCSA